MLTRIFSSLRRLRRTAGLGVAALAITLVIGLAYYLEATQGSNATPLLKGELAFRDLLAQKGRRSAPRSDLVFLGYDEASLSLEGVWPDEIDASPALKALSTNQGHWPVPRSVQAAALTRLAEAGAKAVVFDFVFLGPSADDDQFRAALDRYKNQVVIGANFDFRHRAVTLPSFTLIPPVKPPDDRVGYVEYLNDRADKVFALSYRATVGDLARDPTADVFESLVARTLRKIGRADLIPTHSINELYAFRFSEDFQPRPVYEIFSDALWQSNYHNGADLKGKIVLIGPTASILHDFHPTPLGPTAGPAIHLHALAAALNRDFIRLSTRAEDLLAIAVAGLLAWLIGVRARAPLPRIGVLLLAGGIYVALVFWFFNHVGLEFYAFTPLVTLYTNGFGGLIGEYIIERREKKPACAACSTASCPRTSCANSWPTRRATVR